MKEERLLDVAQLVERLQVTDKTVRKWIGEGKLPAVNLGHKIGFRVKEADLERFLAGRRVRG